MVVCVCYRIQWWSDYDEQFHWSIEWLEKQPEVGQDDVQVVEEICALKIKQ